MGDMSDCLMDWRISTTVARWMSYGFTISIETTLEGLSISAPARRYPLFLLSWSVECFKVSGVGFYRRNPKQGILLTLAAASPPYGAFSSAPCSAPSLSPPRSSCFIWLERFWTACAEMAGMEGRREELSKLAGESGSRRSMFMVRQFVVAIA